MRLYAVIENSMICTNYRNDTEAETPEESYYYFTGEQLAEGEDPNVKLLDKFGTETQLGSTFQKFEIIELIPKRWHFDCCGAEIVQRESMTDYDVYSPDGDYMGMFSKFCLSEGMYDSHLLDEGHCPVCEEWSTGAEEYLGKNGWGRTRNMFINMKHISRLTEEELSKMQGERPQRRLRRMSFFE